jgi:DNA-directed RNA polymerase specialized sigma24 family protein
MHSNNRYQGVDSYALFCIRYQARKLARSSVFTEADLEDIEQDLVLYFLDQATKFDPSRSDWKLHIGMIIKKRAIWLRLRAEALKRGGQERPLSIHNMFSLSSDEDSQFVEIISSEEGLWGDPYLRWGQLNAELMADMQRVIDQMPPRLQQLCEWLKEGNPAEISRDTGIPRTTLSSAVGQIRQRMRAAGLEIYLKEASSHSEESAKPSEERANKETKNAGR